MTGCTITVNPTAGGPGANVAVSLASLIEAAVPSIIDGNLDSAYPVVHLAIKSAGVINLVHKSGAVVPATDAMFEFFLSSAPQAKLELRANPGGRLNLHEIFLSATTADQTMWVILYG